MDVLVYDVRETDEYTKEIDDIICSCKNTKFTYVPGNRYPRPISTVRHCEFDDFSLEHLISLVDSVWLLDDKNKQLDIVKLAFDKGKPVMKNCYERAKGYFNGDSKTVL